MKARIKQNVDDVVREAVGAEQLSDPQYTELRDRIVGKVVNLVFTHGDAFEEENNNIWLPEDCFELIKEEEQ